MALACCKTVGFALVGMALAFFFGTQVPIRLPRISVTVGDSKVALLPFVSDDHSERAEQTCSVSPSAESSGPPFAFLPASSTMQEIGELELTF